MLYTDLKALCENSRSTRRYFLSLPVETQMQLSEYGSSIHTAEELHRMVYALEKYNRALSLTEKP